MAAALAATCLTGVLRAQSPPPVPAPAAAPVAPRFVVVLDAAHGGADPGARVSDTLLEKDLVLSLVVRLRSALAGRGITVVSTRDSDQALPALDRANIANHAAAAACLSLHATATGTGVHLFTSSLAPAPARSRTSFLPFQSAQASFIPQGVRLASELNAALSHAQVPVTLGRTSLQPMDSFACPAVAVELAPLPSTAESPAAALNDQAYQQRVLEALTAALLTWRDEWRQQP